MTTVMAVSPSEGAPQNAPSGSISGRRVVGPAHRWSREYGSNGSAVAKQASVCAALSPRARGGERAIRARPANALARGDTAGPLARRDDEKLEETHEPLAWRGARREVERAAGHVVRQ